MTLIGVFFAIPVVSALLLSFTDFDIYSIADFKSTRFVGLKNYTDLTAMPLFWQALRNTLYFVMVGGPLSAAASLAAALLVHSKLTRLKPFFRSAFFAPWVTTLVAVALVWRYIYHPQYGLLNAGLGLLGLGPVDWLGDPNWAMPSIILLSVWKNFGYNMLVFLAGLSSIPEELYEAAALDGAGAWNRLRHITLPMLGPTFVFVGVVTMIASFQIFSEPYVMTQGGPLKSTTTLVLLMYEQGFRWWRLGLAAAIAVVLFLLTLGGTLLQLRLRRRAQP
jgi:multiple sugar transport system permease protein